MPLVQAIGERLREARMRQKIDIADVEASTKIRAKYLRALENEEFGLLPGPTFAKTFLRTYADHLGLDAQLLVEEYRVQHEPRGEEAALIGATSSGRSARRGGRGGGRRAPGPPGPGAVFAGIFVLLLGLIIFLGLTADDKNDEAGDGPPAAQVSDENAAKVKAREKRRQKRAREKRAKARAKAKPTVVRLRLTPAEPTYACVVDGSGKQLFGGTLSRPQSFKAKRIRINIGRTSVKVTVDRKRVGLPGGSDPVGYDLRPGRKPKPLPLGRRPNC